MAASHMFYYSLSYLGLYRTKPTKLVFVGLNHAGKSSLLQNCADHVPDFAAATSHTSHPGSDSETLIKGNVSFTTLDVGRHHRDRELWIESIRGALGIVFMVDAHDTKRFDEAAAELHALSAAEELEGVPFLVLGNKIDHPDAITTAQVIRDRLRVDEIQNRPIRVFMCSVAARLGYGEGIGWLASKI
ncbi:small COPII coat GTPase sar1 [Chaetomium strumarium]|uniref:Small COPII coat GTPase sar1 n=1 Tax=Chaetomium strumarium TaxID=1170767 RepID=A0AAJ0GLR4_9PEZI|nr:small COPII coat GTPase sar1 [Chaetomium strumarium]